MVYSFKVKLIVEMRKMARYLCEICGNEGYPLKPGFQAMGIPIHILCTDDFIEFEARKHRYSK